MKNGKSLGIGFAEGLLVGGLAATAVTLLYAPKSGKKMRKDIQRKSSRLFKEAEAQAENVQKKTERFIKDTEKQFEKVRKNTESVVDNVMDRFGNLRESIDSKMKFMS